MSSALWAPGGARGGVPPARPAPLCSLHPGLPSKGPPTGPTRTRCLSQENAYARRTLVKGAPFTAPFTSGDTEVPRGDLAEVTMSHS